MQLSHSLQEILNQLRSARFHFQNEAELHEAIRSLLGPDARCEVLLNERDRIDFLMGSTGIETKVDGAAAAVVRQLHRYAQSDLIESLILVTNRVRHRCIPNRMNGKPVLVFFIEGGL